ncbi:uncharacterized protein LOC119573722 [Penaeus monodon]|uniref:uncharacterized protein LOC119573722 n=1 Tax=Penaeus monodon TaxID=6687 RepID=UPI0018A793C3|nr:uncharacterized protein LOC119573722 [Penaeus monodon]
MATASVAMAEGGLRGQGPGSAAADEVAMLFSLHGHVAPSSSVDVSSLQYHHGMEVLGDGCQLEFADLLNHGLFPQRSEGGVGGRRSHFAGVSLSSNPYSFLNDDELVEGRKIYKNPRNAPSDSCPKDEDAVARAGRTCLRKCSTDADCLSRKKVCLCDGICGMSCIKPDKECSDLDNPGFGYVDVKGKVVGSQANYRCQEGYHLIGQTIRLCQANGIWSSTPPECHENCMYLSLCSSEIVGRDCIRSTWVVGAFVPWGFGKN